MSAYLFSIGIVINRVIEMISDDQNKSTNHESVEHLVDVEFYIHVSIFIAVICL